MAMIVNDTTINAHYRGVMAGNITMATDLRTTPCFNKTFLDGGYGMIRYRHTGIIGGDGNMTTISNRHLLVADDINMMVAVNRQHVIFLTARCVTDEHHATVVLNRVLVIVEVTDVDLCFIVSIEGSKGFFYLQRHLMDDSGKKSAPCLHKSGNGLCLLKGFLRCLTVVALGQNINTKFLKNRKLLILIHIVISFLCLFCSTPYKARLCPYTANVGDPLMSSLTEKLTLIRLLPVRSMPVTSSSGRI